MQGKNRDTDAIMSFCKKYQEYAETVTTQAMQLKAIAGTAENSLRDDVGKESIRKVEEFCDEVMNAVYQGEQPVLELEKINRRDQDDMERLRGMSR